MRILLSNDDGYDAEGLQTLAERLRREHEVWIVAPSYNRSGASCSLLMYHDLLLQEKRPHEYALEGTPVDCIVSALRGSYLPSLPDLVVSGINHGGNIGTDIMYSGTCGAARQASLYGVPSIALSVERRRGVDVPAFDFSSLADFAARNLAALLPLCGPADARSGSRPYFVNINAPSDTPYRGVRFASLSQRIYGDKVNLLRKNDEKVYSTCVGGDSIHSVGSDCCDAALVENGYVAISVLYAEPVAEPGVCNQDASQFVV